MVESCVCEACLSVVSILDELQLSEISCLVLHLL